MKSKFSEAVRVSWAREWKAGSPKRIIKLAFGTVYYSAVYFLIVPIVRAYRSARSAVIIGYRYARDYYFRALLVIEYGPGFYANERREIKRREDWKRKTAQEAPGRTERGQAVPNQPPNPANTARR